MSFLELFALFFKTGVFTVGGGLAAMPILEEHIVQQEIMTSDSFLSMIAVSQSAPGSIGVNAATYFGVTQQGVLGGIISVLALTIPSLIVITTIARFFPHFSDNVVVRRMFGTVRPAVTGLIASVAFSLTLAALFSASHVSTPFEFDISRILIFLLILFLHIRFELKSISLIVIGAVCGVVFL